MTKKPSPARMRTLGISIRDSERAALEEIAVEQEMTISEVVRAMIYYAIDAHDSGLRVPGLFRPSTHYVNRHAENAATSRVVPEIAA